MKTPHSRVRNLFTRKNKNRNKNKNIDILNYYSDILQDRSILKKNKGYYRSTLRQLRDHIKSLIDINTNTNKDLIHNLKLLLAHAENQWNRLNTNIKYTSNPMFSPSLTPKYDD